MANIRENILILLRTNTRMGEGVSAGIRSVEQSNIPQRREIIEYYLQIKRDLDLRREKYWRGLIRHTDYSKYGVKVND